MAAVKGSRSITTTKNYRLFKIDSENRALDLPKHRKLKESLKQYGFLRSFPVVCSRDEEGHLVVKDGQHRLAYAEELGLPVHYVVEEVEFDIAVVNCTPKGWALRDYATKYASNGVQAYVEGLQFADEHSLPIGVAFALLAGTTTFGNIQNSFQGGTFKIKDRTWAHVVASTYTSVARLSKAVKNSNFLKAVMCLCRVPEFEPERLIHGAEQCRDKLVSYSTREAYLEMAEELYNFRRHKLVPIKIAALQAMKDRSPNNLLEVKAKKSA